MLRKIAGSVCVWVMDGEVSTKQRNGDVYHYKSDSFYSHVLLLGKKKSICSLMKLTTHITTIRDKFHKMFHIV